MHAFIVASSLPDSGLRRSTKKALISMKENVEFVRQTGGGVSVTIINVELLSQNFERSVQVIHFLLGSRPIVSIFQF